MRGRRRGKIFLYIIGEGRGRGETLFYLKGEGRTRGKQKISTVIGERGGNMRKKSNRGGEGEGLSKKYRLSST